MHLLFFLLLTRIFSFAFDSHIAVLTSFFLCHNFLLKLLLYWNQPYHSYCQNTEIWPIKLLQWSVCHMYRFACRIPVLDFSWEVSVRSTKTVNQISWLWTEVSGKQNRMFFCEAHVFISFSFVPSTDTSISEIEECFKRFVKRDDIDIILINQNVSKAHLWEKYLLDGCLFIMLHAFFILGC